MRCLGCDIIHKNSLKALSWILFQICPICMEKGEDRICRLLVKKGFAEYVRFLFPKRSRRMDSFCKVKSMRIESSV